MQSPQLCIKRIKKHTTQSKANRKSLIYQRFRPYFSGTQKAQFFAFFFDFSLLFLLICDIIKSLKNVSVTTLSGFLYDDL